MKKVAIVGATGMVGRTMLKVLQERDFPISELLLVASDRSKGQEIEFRGKRHTVITIEEALLLKPEIALFSAGGIISKEYAQQFAKQECTVIDNSSAWRMDQAVPLIVPEVNGYILQSHHKVIANPNCSTMQLVIALKPLHDLYHLKRLVISTYQSVSGTGQQAVQQMENERNGIVGEMVYPYPIDKNALPHCDIFMENDYTKEEMKLVYESRKILDLPELKVTATAVRIPTAGGHSEAVNVEFEKEFDITEVRKALNNFPGLKLQDNPLTNTYPMPIYAHNKDEVFVGRLRRDESQVNTLNMWIVADNLRKGAATNAVQIAELV